MTNTPDLTSPESVERMARHTEDASDGECPYCQPIGATLRALSAEDGANMSYFLPEKMHKAFIFNGLDVAPKGEFCISTLPAPQSPAAKRRQTNEY